MDQERVAFVDNILVIGHHQVTTVKILIKLYRAGLRAKLAKCQFKIPSVVPPPQESMDNSPSLFNYRLDNPYHNLIDDFDPYLEYGKGYQNRTAFEDAFYG